MPQGIDKKEVKEVLVPTDFVGKYSDIRDMLDIPGKRIKVKGRNGYSMARKYHLSADKLKEKLKLWHETGRMPTPYTRSVLSDLLISLVNLGVNKAHPLYLVMGEMRRGMSEELTLEQEKAIGRPTRVREGVSDWIRFEKREKRSEKGLGLIGRLIATAMSLRKIDEEKTSWPIGAKLKQMGCCVDIFRVGSNEGDGSFLVWLRLNTYSTAPLKLWLGSIEEIPVIDMGAPTMGPR